MRFSELNGKEIIDLNNGERIGTVGYTDLVIDPESGDIESLILPKASLLGIKKSREEIYIPWNSIRKIGPDMIIVEARDKAKLF